MNKSTRENAAVSPLKAGSVTPEQLASGDPDPRLVELVRLLARRAARQWYEKMMTERGQLRS
jgi:hypothetical protein